jgi:hypothetical protein
VEKNFRAVEMLQGKCFGCKNTTNLNLFSNLAMLSNLQRCMSYKIIQSPIQYFHYEAGPIISIMLVNFLVFASQMGWEKYFINHITAQMLVLSVEISMNTHLILNIIFWWLRGPPGDIIARHSNFPHKTNAQF